MIELEKIQQKLIELDEEANGGGFSHMEVEDEISHQ